MNRKTITSAGMDWTVISRNERETTHKGRHFLAARCGPARPWRIRELNTPLRPVSGGISCAKSLRHFGDEHETRQLTQAVVEICGGQQ